MLNLHMQLSLCSSTLRPEIIEAMQGCESLKKELDLRVNAVRVYESAYIYLILTAHLHDRNVDKVARDKASCCATLCCTKHYFEKAAMPEIECKPSLYRFWTDMSVH